MTSATEQTTNDGRYCSACRVEFIAPHGDPTLCDDCWREFADDYPDHRPAFYDEARCCR